MLFKIQELQINKNAISWHMTVRRKFYFKHESDKQNDISYLNIRSLKMLFEINAAMQHSAN